MSNLNVSANPCGFLRDSSCHQELGRHLVERLFSLGVLLAFIVRETVTWGFLGGSVVKNLPVIQETQVWSLGWEDPPEEGMATDSSSILAWRIPWTEEPGGLQSMGVANTWTWLKSLSNCYWENARADFSSPSPGILWKKTRNWENDGVGKLLPPKKHSYLVITFGRKIILFLPLHKTRKRPVYSLGEVMAGPKVCCDIYWGQQHWKPSLCPGLGFQWLGVAWCDGQLQNSELIGVFLDFRNRNLPAPAETAGIHTEMAKILWFYTLHHTLVNFTWTAALNVS